MSDCEAYLDQMIGIQHQAVRIYCIVASGIFAIGAVIVILAFQIASFLDQDMYKMFFSVGGCFISSLSTIQIKEILTRRTRIAAFRTLKQRMAVADEDERDRIEKLAWEIIEKTALG